MLFNWNVLELFCSCLRSSLSLVILDFGSCCLLFQFFICIWWYVTFTLLIRSMCHFFNCDCYFSPNTIDVILVPLRSESLSGMCAKLRTVAASDNRDHLTRSFYYCLFVPHIHGVVLHTHSVRSEPCISAQRQRSGCNNIPSFLLQTALIVCSLCEDWTQHSLHILVTAPFCWDWKARAACAQSFALWQQATIEITRRHHSIIACSRHTYGVVHRTHSVCGEPHISGQHQRSGCNSA